MRLGLHRHSGLADAAFRAYVERVRPPMVKLLDPGPGDEALAAWCKARGVRVIGRKYFKDQYLGAQGSRQAVEVASLARQVPGIELWELHNEAWSIPGEMRRYAELSIDFMRMMEDQGKLALFGCFSEGTPQVDGSDNDEAWRQFLPALERAIVYGHVLGLHEYSGPYMQHDANDPPGSNTGWHTLRYRKSLDVLKRLGLDTSKLRIAITESGIDDVHPRPGPQGKGWKDFDVPPWNQPPWGNFAQQLHWYGAELSKDPQVVGWVDFGWADASGDWGSFDLSTRPDMFGQVADLQLTLPGSSTRPPQEAPMLEGIDVSRWQGVMNWPQAKQAGTMFAFIKATQGTDWVDPQWSANAMMAGRSGIPFGPYHYYVNALDPIRQAENFARAVKDVAFQLPPALDLEDHDTPLDEAAFVRFAQRVEQLLGRPIIYTARWFINGYVDGDLSALAKYPLWQAEYVAGWPPPPKPWAQPAQIWQYTSKGNGAAFGAQSQFIDRNRFRGTLDELLALRALPAPTPPGTTIDWAQLGAHAAREQEIRGVHMNPDSALLKAVRGADLEVVLGETTYVDNGTPRVYAVGESWDRTRKSIFVWDAVAGKVVEGKVRG